MTHFLQDILRQPDELRRVVEYLSGAGRRPLGEAAGRVREARHVYLTGIGSSWHAAQSAHPLFQLGAQPIYLQEASELWQFSSIPPDAVIVIISRSGRSLEVVKLLAKARESGAVVVGVTNSEDGPLALEAQIPILVPIEFDHAISVNTYSSLAATAGALASATIASFDTELAATLTRTLVEVEEALPSWQARISNSAWPAPRSASYFLARGCSLGSCHEARLLWEEGVKAPATAMSTSSFRHGSQEMVSSGAGFGIWVDGQRMRKQDLAVARDLAQLGASVMVIGQRIPEGSGNLVLQLPDIPADWQFLIDIIPAQLAAEHLARLSGVDPDSFRYGSYIVENEYGLTHEKVAIPEQDV